jgi:2-keto-4-pentenoate hydratase
MNLLDLFLAWRARKHAARALRAAEQRRHAIMAQRQFRKDKHRAFRFLDGDLIQATNASLRASVGQR